MKTYKIVPSPILFYGSIFLFSFATGANFFYGIDPNVAYLISIFLMIGSLIRAEVKEKDK